MLKGASRSETAFLEYLDRLGDVFPIAQLNRPFFSLSPDVEGYRTVIETLGFDAGVSALRALRDAVVIRMER